MCFLRHAEHHARNRTSLAGLEQDLLFFGPPHTSSLGPIQCTTVNTFVHWINIQPDVPPIFAAYLFWISCHFAIASPLVQAVANLHAVPRYL